MSFDWDASWKQAEQNIADRKRNEHESKMQRMARDHREQKQPPECTATELAMMRIMEKHGMRSSPADVERAPGGLAREDDRAFVCQRLAFALELHEEDGAPEDIERWMRRNWSVIHCLEKKHLPVSGRHLEHLAPIFMGRARSTPGVEIPFPAKV